MSRAIDIIGSTGILPVIKIEDIDKAVPLARALRAGGINAIEVTVRNDVAFDAIRAISAEFPDMAVGAGTITSPALADEAVAAGAKYIVSPGFNPDTVRRCLETDVPIVPGCSTASEMELAAAAGLSTVKFFPAESCGGVEALKMFHGPFSAMRYIPTGGLSMDTVGGYLRLDYVLACGGSFIAKPDRINAGDWAGITADCRRAVAVSLGFELAHVGVNNDDAQTARSNAEALDAIFALGISSGSSSVFCGTAVEFMKSDYYGANGHIGFYTNSASRAKAWFESNGIAIRPQSLRAKGGRLFSFYLGEEIGGFAIHVIAR